MNYFELYSKSKHFNTFQNNISFDNTTSFQKIEHYKNLLTQHGATATYAKKAANKMLVNTINAQDHIRYAIDYYEAISVLIIVTIIMVALFPYINRTIVTITKKQPSPF